MKQTATRTKRMQPKRPYTVFIYLCGTSLFFMIGGIVLLCLWSTIHNYIINSNLVLTPNSAIYDVWIRNPVPLTLRLHVFNWTNPKDIYNSSVKPKFEQLGPYVYTETKEKTNITWNANNTVTFKHLKKWWFDATTSNGSLTDPVTSINPVSLSAAYATRNWGYLIRKGLSLTLNTMVHSVAITRSVGEVLFDGYTDPLLNVAATLPFLSENNFPKMDKFGWFYGRNESEDYEGIFNMDTGVAGTLGELYRWKYVNHTPYYPGRCGSVGGGSAGDLFPTDLTKESIIKFFSSDLCRFVELEFEKEEIVNGIVGYKYSAGLRFLDNGTKLSENKCFCDGDCMPSGALNVSACRYGSPSFVSLPKFHKADPYYLQDIEGVTPNAKDSDFFMIFEPKTGIPLQVAARLQLNLRIQSIPGITLYENVPTLYFPVLWFEQVVVIPDSMVFKLKLLVNFKVICLSISIILIFIGVLIEVCAFYKLCTTNLFGRKKSDKVAKEEVPLNQ